MMWLNRRHLANVSWRACDLLALLAGEAIGADDVLQHHHRGDAERGEDSQRQQRFDEGKPRIFVIMAASPRCAGKRRRGIAFGAADLHVQRPQLRQVGFHPCQRMNQRARRLHRGFRPAQRGPAFSSRSCTS
jgi:hypothetical protein